MTQDSTFLALPRREADPTWSFVCAGFMLRFPERTRYLLRIHLRQWADWCLLHGLDPMSVHRAHIEAWSRHLGEERKLTVQTVRAKLNAVCGVYKFAAADGFLSINPAAHVRRPRVEFRSTTNGLTRNEAAALLKVAEQRGPQPFVMACLLLLNGLRASELLAVDIEHLGYERGYRTIYLPHRKGDKTQTISVPIRTMWAIHVLIGERTTGPLFLGGTNGRLGYGAAMRLWKSMVAEIGITRRIVLHSARHTFVTLSLDAGVSIRDLMNSTGHSSSSMITYYDRDRASIERNASHVVSTHIGIAV